MDHFPKTWLPIIGKHLRRQLGLAADARLPEPVQAALEKLRMAEIARMDKAMEQRDTTASPACTCQG